MQHFVINCCILTFTNNIGNLRNNFRSHPKNFLDFSTKFKGIFEIMDEDFTIKIICYSFSALLIAFNL